MALDVLGPDDITVDGDMSRPSDPIPYKGKSARVFAPIAFSVRKTFWKKFYAIIGDIYFEWLHFRINKFNV